MKSDYLLLFVGNRITYYLFGQDTDGLFSINNQLGTIRVAKPLNRVKSSFIILGVRAVAGTPPVIGRAQVGNCYTLIS